jgi:hypothetical protein
MLVTQHRLSAAAVGWLCGAVSASRAGVRADRRPKANGCPSPGNGLLRYAVGAILALANPQAGRPAHCSRVPECFAHATLPSFFVPGNPIPSRKRPKPVTASCTSRSAINPAYFEANKPVVRSNCRMPRVLLARRGLAGGRSNLFNDKPLFRGDWHHFHLFMENDT